MKAKSSGSSKLRFTRQHIISAAQLGLLTVILLAGCGGYGAVSHGTYEHAMALYSICNRQDEPRLNEFLARLESNQTAGRISARESGWLREIVEVAQGGEWQQAAAMSRQMLSDQVER